MVLYKNGQLTGNLANCNPVVPQVFTRKFQSFKNGFPVPPCIVEPLRYEGEENTLTFRTSCYIDGDLFVAGQTGKRWGAKGYIARMDTRGNILWEEQLLVDGFDTEWLDCAYNPVTNTICVAGDGDEEGADWHDNPLVFAQYDLNGNLISSRSWQQDRNSKWKSVSITEEGNIILGGKWDNGGAAGDDAIVKLDPDANVIWFQTFGSTYDALEACVDILNPSGEESFVYGVESSDGPGGAVVFKYDLDGNQINSNGVGFNGDVVSIHAYEEKIIIGMSDSSGVYTYAIDEDLNVLWSTTYSEGYKYSSEVRRISEGYSFYCQSDEGIKYVKLNESGEIIEVIQPSVEFPADTRVYDQVVKDKRYGVGTVETEDGSDGIFFGW